MHVLEVVEGDEPNVQIFPRVNAPAGNPRVMVMTHETGASSDKQRRISITTSALQFNEMDMTDEF